MAHNKKNFAIGLVATAPTPALSGTSLILYPGQGADMPAVPFFMTAAPQGVLTKLDTAEVIEVTDVTDDTLTIVRAQKGTTAKEIGVDWIVANGIYTEDLDEYELLLPETPVDPSNKFLNGNRQWTEILVSIRHSQLRDLNGDENNVHVTTDEKSAITHANRTALDLVQNTNTGDQVADGITITGTGTELDPFVGVGSNQLITDETPTGLVNSANLNYTVANAYTAGTMQVYINGVKQVRGTHFTEVGPGYTIFTMSDAPLTGDVISVNYQTTISTSGNADTVDGFNASSTPTANTLLPLNDDAKINNNLIYNPYMFSAYANVAQNTAGGATSSRVALNAELFDISSNYDSVTNSRFVAPIDGFYYFNGGVQMGNSLSTSWNAQLFKNGIGVINGSSASAITFSVSTVSGDIQLNAGDYVELHIFSSSAVAINPVAPSTYFQGHLISAS